MGSHFVLFPGIFVNKGGADNRVFAALGWQGHRAFHPGARAQRRFDDGPSRLINNFMIIGSDFNPETLVNFRFLVGSSCNWRIRHETYEGAMVELSSITF